MATLYTLVGIPGSGKSTYANAFMKKDSNIKIVSSDKIREELFGNEATQGDNNKIFSIVHERIREYLKKGNDVIFDATNINPRNRKEVFKDSAEFNVAVYFDIPVEECKKRNANRERNVPDYVIDRMYKNIIPPTKEEGFDYISHIALDEEGRTICLELDNAIVYKKDEKHEIETEAVTMESHQ